MTLRERDEESLEEDRRSPPSEEGKNAIRRLNDIDPDGVSGNHLGGRTHRHRFQQQL